MTDRDIYDRLTKLEEISQETHDAVVRLSTQMNGGPGQSFICNQHRAMVQDMDNRLRHMEQKTWYFLGSVGVLVFLLGLFGPALRAALRLP